MLLARSSANRTIFGAKSNVFPGQGEWNTAIKHIISLALSSVNHS